MPNEKENNVICIALSDMFNTEDGKIIFNYFREILIQPVADPDKDVSHAYFREGQNQLIRHLLEKSDLGRQIKNGLIQSPTKV